MATRSCLKWNPLLQYAKGRFDNEPIKEAALEDRVRQLERLVGKLTPENEFLKKAVQGNAVSLNNDTTLCLEALRMAITHRNPPKGIIHHSDRGVQYASHDYVDMLLKNGFRISMSRRGNPYDNATAEIFIKTLKTEEVYLWEYRTLNDVQIRLSSFIEEVYNRKRRHSSLRYRPPVEYEELFMKTNAKLSQ